MRFHKVNICLVFNVELRFTFLGLKSTGCPEQLESMKQSATKLGVFITCTLVAGMLFLNLCLGGGKDTTPTTPFLSTFI